MEGSTPLDLHCSDTDHHLCYIPAVYLWSVSFSTMLWLENSQEGTKEKQKQNTRKSEQQRYPLYKLF